MSYEKRPNKRKTAPGKEKNIIEDIPISFGGGNKEQRKKKLSVSVTSASSAGSRTNVGGIITPGKDPLSLSPQKDRPDDKQKPFQFETATALDYGDISEDDEEVPGVAMVFDETEVDMEHAEVYHGDGQGGMTSRQRQENESDDLMEDNNEDFFEDRIRRCGWLGLPNQVLNKIQSETELLELGCGERKVGTQLDDDEEEGWETMSESSDSSGEMDPDGDWEESLIYVELDDLPSIQELFATHPDDFLRFQHKSKRHRSQAAKATHPKLDCRFHNFTSSRPMLQIGQRYFSGQWEEVTGSAVFFRRNGEILKDSSTRKDPLEPPRPSDELKSIVPDPDIPFDPVFMKLGASYKNAYEFVAVADKVLKMSAHIASTKKMPKTVKPGGNRLISGGKLSVPTGYTARAILAGQYKPMRKYTNKKYKTGKTQKWKEIQGQLTVLGGNEREEAILP